MALQKLDWNSDFEVADGYTDIRGFKVKDSMGMEVGHIVDLIIDPDAREVRYVVTEIDRHRTLVPIGQVDIETRAKLVVARGFTRAQLKNLREYKDIALDEHEERLRGFVGRDEIKNRERMATENRDLVKNRDRDLTFSGTEPFDVNTVDRDRLARGPKRADEDIDIAPGSSQEPPHPLR